MKPTNPQVSSNVVTDRVYTIKLIRQVIDDLPSAELRTLEIQGIPEGLR